MGYYAGAEHAEPALVAAAFTSLTGFVALLGANVHTLQSAATALGVSGTQFLFTRPSVYSSKSIDTIKSSPAPAAVLTSLLSGGGGPVTKKEPAVAIGVATFLGGFLVQFFTGVGMTEALASAAGIAGTQSVATRSRVSSPATAHRAAVARLASEHPPEDFHRALVQVLKPAAAATPNGLAAGHRA
jgi:hypothetical protein